MSNGNGSNGNGTLAWWATYVVAPVLVIGLLAVAGWAIGAQSTLQVHETRIDWHDRQAEKVDAKLDRILERLGANP